MTRPPSPSREHGLLLINQVTDPIRERTAPHPKLRLLLERLSRQASTQQQLRKPSADHPRERASGGCWTITLEKHFLEGIKEFRGPSTHKVDLRLEKRFGLAENVTVALLI